MTEYMYPARAGMLRRGTPTFYVNGNSTDEMLHAARTKITDFEPWFLDLRDVTARAHAAWAYRPFGPDCPVYGAVYREIDEARREDVPASAHYQVLRRMACGDETVTVAEARAALDWAHAASGSTR